MDQDTKTSVRGKGKGRGRGRKKGADQEKSVEDANTVHAETKSDKSESITLDLDADITQLEAPTFSTINKGPLEPMLRLSWNHKTHLIGEKVINPMIHCCDKCEAPILIYGRMIPCKHVFCLTCAEHECKICPRCQEKVIRVERTGLGTVFMCTFGGSRYGNTGCRRTYLSQRDLLAHINHRHVSGMQNKESVDHKQTTPLSKSVPTVTSRAKPTVTHHVAVAGDPRIQTNSNHDHFYKLHSSSQPSHRQTHHHSTSHHHNDHRPATTQPNVHCVPHSQSVQQSNQHHLVAPSQQLFSSANQILVPNFPPPPLNPVTIPTIRSNLINIPTQDSNSDSAHSVNLAMPPNFHLPAFTPQFPPPSSGGIPFPVPPPSQSAINALSHATSQFYSNYSLTSSQRLPVTQFSPNSSAQSMMNQSPMMPNQPSTPQMVPPPRLNQFSRENVMQQQYPVTQNHGWQQPNQSQFF